MQLVPKDFDIVTLEDELRVDELCRELLLEFYNERVGAGIGEHEATLLASSADYYIRDYLIGARQINPLDPTPGNVRRFAGNWYIVNNLEPDIEELKTHLDGIREFYSWLAREGAIDGSFLVTIEADCSSLEYYKKRIDSFWNISGDGYFAWERECSLKLP
jgi:hypothetical protein